MPGRGSDLAGFPVMMGGLGCLVGTCIGLRNQGRFIIGLSYFVAMGSHVMPLGFQHLYSVLAARDLLTWTLIPKLFLFHLAVPFGYIDSLAVVNVHLTAFGCLAWLVAVYVFWRQLRLVLYGLTGFEMDRGQEKGEFAWANVRKVFGRHVVLAWLWPFYVLPGDEDVVRRRGNK
ncbi:unnamed protein product [Notodromas monacha]|uniref:Uncharacterized protein n=1 Tax=Notodromas monacha TaxID=399045 RepID=A0A7R9GB78_9CRUS|nr:unnamed protein product [Notodromas monacha]CAG0916051.1 unnamed protein product [Notodromas monacha]